MHRKINHPNSRGRRVLLICLVLVLCFIWGNSLLPPKASWTLSGLVQHTAGQLKPITRADAFLHQREGYTVRKLAHMGEFAVLGALLTALCEPKSRRDRLPVLLLKGLSVALIDEGIQLFTGRTSCLSDVWIDLVGFCIGLTMVFLFAAGSARREKKDSK
ncbi:MAG: VanZ family protein [Clostridia bacterium]|nr:VanZ family protein [Clostridia bacterium]